MSLALLTLVVFMASAALAAEAKVIKLHHLNPNGSFNNPSGASVAVFKSLVESGTNGSVKVEIFPDGQLGKDDEVLQQVKAGVIQAGVHTTGGLASVYPLISVLDIPFGFPNIAATYSVLDGPFGQKLADDIFKKSGLKILGFSDSGGFFQITNSKRPIKKPADLQGLKIRTMGLKTHQTFVSSLGGQPVSISWSEVYTALQTGVADGQMNPIPIVEFAKLYEVQKYLTVSGHLFATHIWVINNDFFNTLSPAEKDVVVSAAKAAIVTGRGIANAIEASERGLPFLATKMEVYALTAEEKAEFRKISVPAVRSYIEGAFGAEGKALLEELLAALEQASK
jgi:tripartite ATP-independent transporter DctP family solute receptor